MGDSFFIGHHFLSVLWVFPCPRPQPAWLVALLCNDCRPSGERQSVGLVSSGASQPLMSRTTSAIPERSRIGRRIFSPLLVAAFAVATCKRPVASSKPLSITISFNLGVGSESILLSD